MGVLGCLVKDCRAGRSLAFLANWAENNPTGVPQANVRSLQGNPPALQTQLMIAMTCSCHGNSWNSHSRTQNKYPWANEHDINTGIKREQ